MEVREVKRGGILLPLVVSIPRVRVSGDVLEPCGWSRPHYSQLASPRSDLPAIGS